MRGPSRVKHKKKIILSLVIILIFIIINDGSTGTFGWVHITSKHEDMGVYYINGYHGNFELIDERLKETIKKEVEKLEIEVRDDYTFKLFVDENEGYKETNISEVWDYIESENSYFIRLKKYSFPKNLYRTYTIEELYLY